MGIDGSINPMLLQVYAKLTGDKPHIQWNKVVWNRLNVPKHRFICWLAMQNRLQTTTKLAKIGVSTSADCLICKQADEIHEHLFFSCQYSQLCLQGLATWFGIHLTSTSLQNGISSIKRGRYSKFRTQVCYAGVAALVYLIWKSRNQSFWENFVPTVHSVMGSLKQIVKDRITTVISQKVNRRDSENVKM
ncbi:uncharacterized protein [Spinacia oleracea]|uniref:Reverse transcriptase zinc-binding domain-containing protein n=1 Tax=Spinacia oleracea TaxID=3562 RepID=A0ABM3RHY4_SPIOL|nr:uncharacterized protein LOC130469774 [Spinacia oleracea]